MWSGLRNALNLGEAKIFIEEPNGQIHQFAGNTILLSNIGKIGDINFKVTPDTSAHDGKFDVTVISSRSLWGLIGVVFRMLTWRFKPSPRLHHFQVREVVIKAEPPLQVQIDGEHLGQTPLSARVLSQGVKFIVGDRYRETNDKDLLLDFKLPHGWLKKKHQA